MNVYKSVVTNATYLNRTFNTQNGTFFVHLVNFSDGNHGEYNSKDEHQQKFVVGQEADYEMILTDNPNHANKIKPYNPMYADATISPVAQNPAPQQQPTQVVTQQAAAPQPKAKNIQVSIERQKALELATQTIDMKAEGEAKLFETAEKFAMFIDGLNPLAGSTLLNEPLPPNPVPLAQPHLDDDGLPF